VRAGGAVNKVFLEIAGRSMVERSVRPFCDHSGVDEAYVVAAPTETEVVADVLRRAGIEVAGVIAGGATRHQSESNAVEHLARWIETGDIDLVIVHDGARPLFAGTALDELTVASRRSGGAICAVPVDEDLFVSAGREVMGRVPREGLWRAQTPQIFRAELLLEAFLAAARDGFEGTDTASTVERIGGRIEVVPGDPRNLKVTFPEDFVIAERLAGAEPP
jgi:2-C-methyl-D-erythritol 4-phosphate cytidylyltransferase